MIQLDLHFQCHSERSEESIRDSSPIGLRMTSVAKLTNDRA